LYIEKVPISKPELLYERRVVGMVPTRRIVKIIATKCWWIILARYRIVVESWRYVIKLGTFAKHKSEKCSISMNWL
jgi:hypothetical protein